MEREYGFLIPLVMTLIIILPISIFIPLLFSENKRKRDNEIEIEGIITEKRIEKGFGKLYIFVINSTSEIEVSLTTYQNHQVGNYVIIFKSGKIKKIY